MDHRPWHDERTMDDAPVWLSSEAAGAWASGYNAAIAAALFASIDRRTAAPAGDA